MDVSLAWQAKPRQTSSNRAMLSPPPLALSLVCQKKRERVLWDARDDPCSQDKPNRLTSLKAFHVPAFPGDFAHHVDTNWISLQQSAKVAYYVSRDPVPPHATRCLTTKNHESAWCGCSLPIWEEILRFVLISSCYLLTLCASFCTHAFTIKELDCKPNRTKSVLSLVFSSVRPSSPYDACPIIG